MASEEKRPGQVLVGPEFTDKTLLGQNFILGAKDDVGVLSPLFSISSERVNRPRRVPILAFFARMGGDAGGGPSLHCTIPTEGAPSFAHFAKGGSPKC